MVKIILTIAGCLIAFFVILGGLGYLFRNQLINIFLSGRPGNAEKYHLKNVKVKQTSNLKGKKLIVLGSSVTYGSASLGVSFVDYLEKVDCMEIAGRSNVSGTTLVTQDKNSYIPRMEQLDKTLKPDIFLCQLSTNDATKKFSLGSVSESRNRSDFDTSTVAGSIEYIISYARETWDCEVAFYTGTKYDSEAYGNMVSLLHSIELKWDIHVLDLWNDDDMNAVSDEDYSLYMVNSIHPSQAGYYEWWLPKFEKFFTGILENKRRKYGT